MFWRRAATSHLVNLSSSIDVVASCRQSASRIFKAGQAQDVWKWFQRGRELTHVSRIHTTQKKKKKHRKPIDINYWLQFIAVEESQIGTLPGHASRTKSMHNFARTTGFLQIASGCSLAWRISFFAVGSLLCRCVCVGVNVIKDVRRPVLCEIYCAIMTNKCSMTKQVCQDLFVRIVSE